MGFLVLRTRLEASWAAPPPRAEHGRSPPEDGREREKEANHQFATAPFQTSQQIAGQFGEFAAFALLQRDVGVQRLADHAVDEVAHPVRQ